ncbi:hypothetical protein BDFB_006527, partial [Asbolus verrucosus]
TVRNYILRFPWRRYPSINVIRKLDQRLRKQGQIVLSQKGTMPGRPLIRKIPRVEEAMIEVINQSEFWFLIDIIIISTL